MLKQNSIVALTAFVVLFMTSTYAEIKSSNVVVLDYKDFGPPSMSFELLGQSWWSWESSGSSDPNEKYPIKVVVFRKVSLQSIQSKYPIIPKLKQDYRYVHFREAKTYLDKNIANNVIPTVTLTLKQTLSLLESQFVE